MTCRKRRIPLSKESERASVGLAIDERNRLLGTTAKAHAHLDIADSSIEAWPYGPHKRGNPA